MNKVPKGDWGPRANIYLYRVEPVIDRTRSGDTKYINCYAEPINEDRIMGDYGSGRYKLILNFRKPGAATGDIIDSDYWDIMNMKYPPKIPLGEWTDDPRNKKWAWAKEANGIPTAPPPQSAAAGLDSLVDVLRVSNEMRREMREEVQTATPPAPAAPVAADPFDTAKKIMEMRANDPMVAALMQRLEAMDRAQEAARAREFDLQKELRQQTSKPAEPSKSLVDQAVELAGAVEKLTPLKALFGLGGNGAAAVETVRAGRTGWLDVTRDLGTKFFESDLASGVGQWLGAMAQRSVGGPMQPNPAQPQVQQKDEAAVFDTFIREVVNPTLLRQYSRGFGGDDFAGWMFDAFPDRLKQLQSLTHARMPGQKGAPVIIAAYQNLYPDTYKPLIAQRDGEASFAQFVQEFCAWKPEEETQEPIDAIPVVEDGEETPERI